MDQLTSAVSIVETELAKLKEENEFLKKKMSMMYTFEEVKNIYLAGMYRPRKGHPFMTDSALRYMFDIEKKNDK